MQTHRFTHCTGTLSAHWSQDGPKDRAGGRRFDNCGGKIPEYCRTREGYTPDANTSTRRTPDELKGLAQRRSERMSMQMGRRHNNTKGTDSEIQGALDGKKHIARSATPHRVVTLVHCIHNSRPSRSNSFLESDTDNHLLHRNRPKVSPQIFR